MGYVASSAHTRISLSSSRQSENLAGAGGFEPPHGGIKIRCLTTWLRPTGESGKLSGKLVCGNKTARGAPPAGFGDGERLSGVLGLAAIGKQGKAGGAAAAHSREQRAGQCAETGEHRADFGYELDRRLGQIVAAEHQEFCKPGDAGRHRRETCGLTIRAAPGCEYRGGRQLTARIGEQ